MGLFDNLKLIDAWTKEALASVPKWARIVSVGRKVGPFQSLTLEIHYRDDPPHEVSTTVWLPRGVKPEVGQHVAYHTTIGDDITHYEVDWDKPPQYGNGPRPPGAPESLETQAVETTRDATHPVHQMLVAKRALDDGLITEAEFERAKEALQAWAERTGH